MAPQRGSVTHRPSVIESSDDSDTELLDTLSSGLDNMLTSTGSGSSTANDSDDENDDDGDDLFTSSRGHQQTPVFMTSRGAVRFRRSASGRFICASIGCCCLFFVRMRVVYFFHFCTCVLQPFGVDRKCFLVWLLRIVFFVSCDVSWLEYDTLLDWRHHCLCLEHVHVHVADVIATSLEGNMLRCQ